MTEVYAHAARHSDDELDRIERRLSELHCLCRAALVERWPTQAQAAEFFAVVAGEMSALLDARRRLRR